MMGRIKNENYYQVSGWMINELGLKGYELQAFAIIYGFTQDGQSIYAGSISYMSEWLGTSRHTTIDTVKKLVDKGLVLKEQVENNRVKANRYRVNPKLLSSLGGSANSALGVVQKVHWGSANSAPNNNINNVCCFNNQDTTSSLKGERNSKAIDTTTVNTNTTVKVEVDSKAIKQDIFTFWDSNIYPLSSGVVDRIKALIEECGEDAVWYGMNAALEQGRRTYPYVRACAKNYLSGGPRKQITGKGNPKNDVVGGVDRALKILESEEF